MLPTETGYVSIDIPGLQRCGFSVSPTSTVTITQEETDISLWIGLQVDDTFHPLVQWKHTVGREHLDDAVATALGLVRAAIDELNAPAPAPEPAPAPAPAPEMTDAQWDALQDAARSWDRMARAEDVRDVLADDDSCEISELTDKALIEARATELSSALYQLGALSDYERDISHRLQDEVERRGLMDKVYQLVEVWRDQSNPEAEEFARAHAPAPRTCRMGLLPTHPFAPRPLHTITLYRSSAGLLDWYRQGRRQRSKLRYGAGTAHYLSARRYTAAQCQRRGYQRIKPGLWYDPSTQLCYIQADSVEPCLFVTRAA